jgi:hypothetical protein
VGKVRGRELLSSPNPFFFSLSKCCSLLREFTALSKENSGYVLLIKPFINTGSLSDSWLLFPMPDFA